MGEQDQLGFSLLRSVPITDQQEAVRSQLPVQKPPRLRRLGSCLHLEAASTWEHEMENLGFLFFVFDVDHLKSSHWICCDIASVVYVLVFQGHKAHGISAPHQG